MTHADLVARAAQWLANTEKCGVVVTEQMISRGEEAPDAIGWRYGGRDSILVECKVSLSDFYADRQKAHRKLGQSCGRRRYYLTPPGLLATRALPDGWGLLEFDGRIVRRVREAEAGTGHEVHEIAMMYALLWRLTHEMPCPKMTLHAVEEPA